MNEITVSPLVDILSKQLGESVVMSGSDYVLLNDKSIVSTLDITIALDEQERLYKTSIFKQFEVAIQSMLDNQAKELGYDSIVSACSYAGYPNDFQTEAIALGVWRSAVWSKAYELQATMVEIPTVEEILLQLPKYGEEI